MPPTAVDFSFSGKGIDAPAADKAEEKVAEEDEKKAETEEENAASVDTLKTDSLSAAPADTAAVSGLWTPVIDELNSFGSAEEEGDFSLWRIFILGVVGGFIALLTPCVWPIIPMTVSFFLKRAKDDKKKGVRDAITYGLSIIVIYLALGLAVTLLFGASALNALSPTLFIVHYT